MRSQTREYKKEMIIFHAALVFACLLLQQAVCGGATYYVDPSSGSMSNDGSYDRPWRTAEEVFESGLIGTAVRAGDTILLRSGYHGEIFYGGANNSDYITLGAQSGHAPYLKKFRLASGSKWVIRGLTISPELAPGEDIPDNLIHIQSGCDEIIIEDNDLFYSRNTSGWSADDWNSSSGHIAILCQGRNTVIRGNRLKNVNFGISISGPGSLVEYNTIENIAGDGMIGGANNVTIQYNVIKNFYKVNANHDDGIQFYRPGNDPTPLENLVIRGNLIMSHEPNADYPLMTSPQGICGFVRENERGYFRNFLIENNIVLLQHWHGISLYGALDSRIINNIACDPTGEYPTWISLNNWGTNCVVRNNMASNYIVDGDNVTADHNIDIEDHGLGALFADYHSYDLRHRQGSPAIDAGSGESAPNIDFNRASRPQGSGYDIGAYEYGSSTPLDIVLGDVTENGEVSSYDASLTAQYSIDLINLTLTQIRAADVTVNNEVSSYDASLISQYAIGLINRF